MAYRSSYRSEAGFTQRSALFGDHSGGQIQVQIDPRNALDDEVTGLRAQVRKLKEVAGEIGSEARQQQDLLQQLEQSMIAGQAALKNGMRRLNKALASGGSSYLVHVILFSLGCFFLVYLWRKFS